MQPKAPAPASFKLPLTGIDLAEDTRNDSGTYPNAILGDHGLRWLNPSSQPNHNGQNSSASYRG